LINLCSPFFMVHLQLVEKEIKRPTSLINLCRPFFMVHLQLVQKELKRVPLCFSCEVLSSYLVLNWSTKKSRGLTLCFLVKSFLHTWFQTGRQQYQKAFLFD
jgi:hypothetical protein